MLTTVMLSAQDDVEKQVNDFIDQWHLDAANANMEAYFDKIAENGIFIGTDETEVWTKAEFYDWTMPRAADGKMWDFSATERNVCFGEGTPYAWFDEKLSFSGGTLRGSGVLIKEGEEWKIMHYVLSLPVPNDKFSAVLEAMEE
jgi:hypothetical protein